MTRAAPDAARPAFTLIEMLVVVAIIVLLLSITVPSMQGAMGEAERVACLANMKEVQRAALMYAKDNDNVTTNGQWSSPSSGGNDLSYSDNLFPYLIPHAPKKPNGGVEASVYEDTPVFECPSSNIPKKDWDASNGQRLDFGINNYGRYNDTDPDLKAEYKTDLMHERLDSVANHTTVYFCDVDSDWDPEIFGGASRGAGDLTWPMYNSISRNAWVRHRGGYNVMQLDGAGAWYRGAEPNFEAFLIKFYYVKRKIGP